MKECLIPSIRPSNIYVESLRGFFDSIDKDKKNNN